MLVINQKYNKENCPKGPNSWFDSKGRNMGLFLHMRNDEIDIY
jgi:hypothetical protein